jgi:hypothetical protein
MSIKRPWQCVLQQMILSHVKISYFLRVFKYDFSQWPKTLYNIYVYIINGKYLTVIKDDIKCLELDSITVVGYLRLPRYIE